MKPKPSLAFIALAVLLTACSSPRYIYSASPPNNAYFKEKGDSKIAAYYSGGGSDQGYNRGFDVQGAYAVTNHVAVTGSLFFRKERDNYSPDKYNFFDLSGLKYKRHLIDFGGGYFTTINPAKTVGFTFFGGLGFGKFSLVDTGTINTTDHYERFYNTNVRKMYFQPAVNIMPGRYFRMMLVHRFSFVHYGGISTSYTDEEKEYFRFSSIENKTRYFGETTFGLQWTFPGAEWLGLDVSSTFSTQPDIDYDRIRARGFNGSIGFSVNLAKMKH